MPRVELWAAVNRLQVDVPDALWALTFRRTKDSKHGGWRADVGPQKSARSQRPSQRFSREVRSETVIMSGLHLFLPAGCRGETVGHFTHTAFYTHTHTALCSVKLPSDVALSEQWLSEQAPWGLSRLWKHERPGGDICCPGLNTHEGTLCSQTLHSQLHSPARSVGDFVQSASGKGEAPSARLVIWGKWC